MKSFKLFSALSVVTIGSTWLACTLASAGVSDSPLPMFSDGKAGLHVYSAVGYVKNNNLETVITCTNLSTEAVNIGVEVFDRNGAPANSVGAGNGEMLDIPVGATVTVASGATELFTEDVVIMLPPNINNGSGRIVATSKSVSCNAWLVDELHRIEDPAVSSDPPPAAVTLPLSYVP